MPVSIASIADRTDSQSSRELRRRSLGLMLADGFVLKVL